MNVMTSRVEVANDVDAEPATKMAEAAANDDQVSHFKQCHCGCTAGERLVAAFVTAIAVLQIIALAVSLHTSAPRGYETLVDVNSALGAAK